jgi:hypothetical protein
LNSRIELTIQGGKQHLKSEGNPIVNGNGSTVIHYFGLDPSGDANHNSQGIGNDLCSLTVSPKELFCPFFFETNLRSSFNHNSSKVLFPLRHGRMSQV